MSVNAVLGAPMLAAFVVAAGDPALAQVYAQTTTSYEPMAVERFGIYVLAADVERSTAFYTTLFGQEPSVRTHALIGFDAAGGLFGIVSRDVYGGDAGSGSGVRAYLRVRDIEDEHRRIRALLPDALMDAQVVGEGAFRFFRLRDPDGHVMELFEFRSRQ